MQIANPLSKIFNKSLSHGIFPDLLEIARIIPIFKRGDSSDPKNYRPISLLPSFSKILEQIIYNRLISFFNKHDILHSSQHGFCTNHSTNSALAEVLDCVTLALNKKFLSLALFIDVSKAFDSLDHQLLFAKSNIYGVRGTALDLLKSYFSNHFQYATVNNDSSNFCKITTGVPQGSIIGPLMYAIYVNDVFNVADFMKCVIYADDTFIIISARTKDELLALATCYLTLYSKWFAINKLCLNDSKTHFFVFGPVGNDNIDTIIFDDNTVKRVNEIPYLGIIIDDHLCWKSHINCVRDKVARGVGMLKMSYTCLPKQCLLTIYYSFIQSYLQYGIEFLGSTYTTYL